MSLSDLTKAKSLLENQLKVAQIAHKSEARSKVIGDFVTQHKNFLAGTADDVLVASIQADLESLDIKRPTSGTSALWLSPDDQSYSWGTKNGTITNNPVSFDKAPAIKQLLDRINVNLGLDLNSCLVTLFKNGRSSIRLHHDDEPEMDPSAPICVLTVGEGRQVDFLSRYQSATEAPLLSIKPKEGSLYVMESGCQEWFKHRVPATAVSVGLRFSLSFRKKISATPELIIQPAELVVPQAGQHDAVGDTVPSPVKTIIKMFDDKAGTTAALSPIETPPVTSTSKVPVYEIELPKRKSTTVLFGTSLTASLHLNKISLNRGRKFVNVSQRGAKIPDIERIVDNFYLVNPSANDVDKVILAFGTNDIKFETGGVKKFKDPIINLIKKTKFYFPDAIILVQCTLPMRNLYWYTCENFCGFNDILRGVCFNYNCVYIDCFHDFLSRDRFDHNRNLYNDIFHLNYWGRNILCHWISKVCNSNSFNRVLDSFQ